MALGLLTVGMASAADLLLHWPLDEADGLTARDFSGNGRDGRLAEGTRHHGGPKFVPGAGWRAGAVKVGSLHGITAEEELALPERFTLSFYLLKPVRSPENRDWVGLGEMRLHVRGTEAILHVPGMGSLGIPRQTAGRWEHVAVSVEPGRVRVHVNGAPVVDQRKEGWVFPAKAALRVTAPRGGYEDHIDDIRVYGGLLDAPAIAALADGLYHPEAPWTRVLDAEVAVLVHELRLNQPDLARMRGLGAPSIPELIRTLEGEAEDAALIWVARALGVLRGERARDALIRRAEQGGSKDPAGLREALMEALGRIGDARAIPAVLPDLGHADEHVRAAARHALAGMGEVSVPPLRSVLRGSLSVAATEAATALQSLGVEPADPEEALWRRIALAQWNQMVGEEFPDLTPLAATLGWDDPARVAAAAKELVRRGADSLVATLAVLKSGSPSARREAARVLGNLRDPRAAESLAAHLGDPDPRVQEACAEALRFLAGPGQVAALARVLGAPNGPTRQAAVLALAEIGPPSVKELLFLLRKGAPVARRHAVEALGRIGDARAREGLLAAAEDPVVAVRAAAVDALGRVDGAPLEVFVRALHDADWLVRRQAVLALRRQETHAARQLLPKVQEDPHPLVRKALSDELGEPYASVENGGAGERDVLPVLSPEAAVRADMGREYETRAWTPAEEVLSGALDKRHGFGRDLNVRYITEGYVDRLSRVPPPGVHPRVIMSPEDIDQLRRLLALGDNAPDFFRSELARLRAIAAKTNPGVTQAPWFGPSTGLAQKALYALITEDQRIGREAVELLLARAADLEHQIRLFDEEWGPTGHNDMVYSAISSHSMGLGMAYDYAHAFMTDEERDAVRSVISKATYGRYTSFMDQPDHFQITNHLAFAMNWWLELLAIEGEEGFDERAAAVGLHKVEAYLNAVVSKKGFPFEGVKPSISPYAFLAAQRRGHRKAVQSDHLHAYTLNVLNGLYWKHDPADPTRGRWHGQRPNASDGDEMGVYPAPFLKYFYPEDPLVDTAWQATGGGVRHANTDLSLILGECVNDALGWKADDPVLPAAVRERVPLTWVDRERGMMRTRAGWAPDDLMLRFEARDNYYSAGHEGVETFALDLVADGVDWTYYPGRYQESRLHGVPQIDGRGPTRWQPIGAKILAVHDTPEATAFVADATDEFNWWKFEKTSMLWHPDLDVTNAWLKNNGWLSRRRQEVPFLPGLRWYYEGFGHPEFGNWHGETRGLESYYLEDRGIDLAMRTVHLARGGFPYILILDDLRMDRDPHLYEFILKVRAEIERQGDGDIVLTRGRGTERLLVRVLHAAAPYEAKLVNRRLEISTTAVAPEFRILVYPFRMGEPLPETAWSGDDNTLSVDLPGQQDLYRFASTDRGRTVYSMTRNQALVVDVDTRPAAPQLADRGLWMGGEAGYGGHSSALPEERMPSVLPFADQIEVKLTAPTPETLIRFTLDGSVPSNTSILYDRPIQLEKTTTLKARAFAGADWPGKVNVSGVFEMTFEKRPPAAGLKSGADGLIPGLVCEFHEVYQTIYDNETGYFTGQKRMLPLDNRGGADLERRHPLLRTVVAGLETPRAEPVAPTRRMSTGYYGYRGFIQVDEAGTYRFRLNSPGPVRLRIAGQTAIENAGVYYNAQRCRYGAVTMRAGLHPFELVVADPDFFRRGMSPALSLELDWVRPGGDAFVPVDAAAFQCEAPGILADPVNIGEGTVSFAPPSAGTQLRYTVARRGLEEGPVSQEWPTAESPLAGDPLVLKEPGHYVISVAEFKDGKAVTPAVQKRVAVLPVHEAVTVEKPAAGLIQRVYTRVPDKASDYDALASGELDLAGRLPLQKTVITDLTGAKNAADKPLLVHTGYFKAPVDGLYAFDLEHTGSVEPRYKVSGAHRLTVAGTTVAATRIGAPQPFRLIHLKAGLHPVRLDLIDGKLEWRVRMPMASAFVPVGPGMLFYDDSAETSAAKTP